MLIASSVSLDVSPASVPARLLSLVVFMQDTFNLNHENHVGLVLYHTEALP